VHTSGRRKQDVRLLTGVRHVERAAPKPSDSIMEVLTGSSPGTVSSLAWQEWASLPFLQAAAPAGNELRLALRLLESSLDAPTVDAYLKQQLPEVASEFAASWVAVWHRQRDWRKLAEFGRQPVEQMPLRLLSEALERDAGGAWMFDAAGPAHGIGFAAAPAPGRARGTELLVWSARNARPALPQTLIIARALGFGMGVAGCRQDAARREERLRATLAIASQLSLVREMKPLLELIAREAARLLQCDRASIFLWNRAQHEAVACPALGLEWDALRIPDNVGIVGECLQTGKVVVVDDAYADPRFNRQVDLHTGYKTRNLLCVPLMAADGQRLGAFEAINKHLGDFTEDDETALAELGVQVAAALENTQERERLVKRQRQFVEQAAQSVQIVGSSPQITALRATLERLAATDLPVLILGESGTGKEVVAQALHFQSPRRELPFIAVNCAAMTESLLESELFGHEKGAFTDARETRQGKFELAQGGTIFLDEIGDMSPNGQAKLLRVLEQKVINRVGGSQALRIDARIVAATNVNLQAAVREKRFREDLYYRLSVVALELPALRDRPQDILPLARHFLERFCAQAGRKPLVLSAEAEQRLVAHAWPGNVRELRNLMERVAFLAGGDRVERTDLAFVISPDGGAGAAEAALGLAEATNEFQQEYIRRMIRRAGRNRTEAARLLGLHRSNLYRKMKQLGMSDTDEFDAE
jgi:Nif-specific regulatory protein